METTGLSKHLGRLMAHRADRTRGDTGLTVRGGGSEQSPHPGLPITRYASVWLALFLRSERAAAEPSWEQHSTVGYFLRIASGWRLLGLDLVAPSSFSNSAHLVFNVYWLWTFRSAIEPVLERCLRRTGARVRFCEFLGTACRFGRHRYWGERDCLRSFWPQVGGFEAVQVCSGPWREDGTPVLRMTRRLYPCNPSRDRAGRQRAPLVAFYSASSQPIGSFRGRHVELSRLLVPAS